MQPIHELLARIRWDAAYARSRFVIGYWDRVAREIQHVSLREIDWSSENRSIFEVIDEEGARHSVPFHRVREVWRDGTLIWNRDVLAR